MEVLVMFTIIIKTIGSIILLQLLILRWQLKRADFACYGLFQRLFNLRGLPKKNMCVGNICKYLCFLMILSLIICIWIVGGFI